jgi:glutamine cyclotransferase
MTVGLVTSIVLFSLVISCGGKPAKVNESHDSKTVTDAANADPAPELVRLLQPAHNAELKAGGEVTVIFEHQSRTIPDSVEIYFGGRLLTTIRDSSVTTTIPAALTASTGIRSVKVMAYSVKRRPQSVSVFITILSDVVPEKYGYRTVRVFPHDPDAYTQGLLWHNGFLYEGTGQEGHSSLRKVVLETGTVLQKHNLDSKFFGEGIAISGNQIYQLTWQSKVGFIYDLETFRELGRFYYNTEGWGLTTIGKQLVMSDGSNKLYFIDPLNFNTVSTIEVYDNQSMVVNLNELEYIGGEIWANIYMTDLIARIDPSTGKVTGYLDLVGIISPSERRNDGDDVLNGIAWDPDADRIFVTGKNWPKLFEISVTKR